MQSGLRRHMQGVPNTSVGQPLQTIRRKLTTCSSASSLKNAVSLSARAKEQESLLSTGKRASVERFNTTHVVRESNESARSSNILARERATCSNFTSSAASSLTQQQIREMKTQQNAQVIARNLRARQSRVDTKEGVRKGSVKVQKHGASVTNLNLTAASSRRNSLKRKTVKQNY